MKVMKWHLVLICLVEIMNVLFASCRPVSVPNTIIPHPSPFLIGKDVDVDVDNRAFKLHNRILNPEEEENKIKKMKGEEVEKMIGSRPPSCANKCFGCMPCEAIQVPTTTVSVQYANYFPEGWKCKCGPTLYTP